MLYRCLHCRSTQGSPGKPGHQLWYWRIVENGRIGPFCSEACASLFRMNGGEAEFTLQEYQQLAFLQHMYRLDHGEPGSASVVVSGRDLGDEG